MKITKASRRALLSKRWALGSAYTKEKAFARCGNKDTLAFMRGRIDAIDNDIMLVESLLLSGGIELDRTPRFFK